jgi:hypothetical protein
MPCEVGGGKAWHANPTWDVPQITTPAKRVHSETRENNTPLGANHTQVLPYALQYAVLAA